VRCHVGCDDGYLVVNDHGEVRNATAVEEEPLDDVQRLALGGVVRNLPDVGASTG
jgi:hypothetical protein